MRQQSPILLSQLKADHEAVKSLGAAMLQCQGMLVPRDYPDLRFLIMSCPRPMVTNNDAAEVNLPGGVKTFVPGIPQTMYEGSLQLQEFESGQVTEFMEMIVANGGSIACDYYDGRMDAFTRVYELDDCAITMEQGEASAEGRSQGMTHSGSIKYMYFGQHADVGLSGTVLPGKTAIAGIEALINRSQEVINVAKKGVGFAKAVSGLFG